jgi:hypothetical protein
LAAVVSVATTGCKKRELPVPREGQGVKVAGVTYNVYITRQLNPHDAEDSAYTAGSKTEQAGYYFYGVFLTACNENTNGVRLTPTADFSIHDTQGNQFRPLVLPRTNVFAYRPKLLAKKSCVPEAGSLAASGPTAGALLVFRVPVTTVENRPLDLEIKSGTKSERVELDI